MNAPKLRFNEFTDEWKKIDLSKTFLYFSTNSLSRDQLDSKGKIMNIHYGDIHKKYKVIVEPLIDIETYVKDKNYIKTYELCKENDIIFADASEDYEGIGKAIELVNIKENTIISGLHTIHARDISKEFSPKFKGYYFNSPVIHNQIRIMANGFKVFGISRNTINKLNAKIPNKVEQNKIGNFLYLLDKKIELQTKKVEALKLFKLCNLKLSFFSVKYSKKLKDICSIQKGKQVNSEKLADNGIYYMLNGGINPSGRINEYNTLANTITISEGGNSCGYVKFNVEKFWCGGHCYTVRPININNEYLFQLLKFHEKKIMNLRVGSSLPNIQKKDLENYKVSIHEHNKQVKIGKQLFLLDKKITLEIIKLEKLNNLKKGLMQSMFI